MGLSFGFENNKGSILVYENDVLYFRANICNGIYEIVIGIEKNDSLILKDGSSKDGLDKSWI